ncbi:MAG: FAD-dependent oxidoreductase [Candidatus Abawacabacteria bacterium]|nr:FAD-dependent oxidoreductase [Candidatus Abawacabacteria bacterium]
MAATGIHESLWLDTFDWKQKYPKLTTDITAEICVVGAGISGLTVAYLLQKAGKKVILVEAGNIGSGETARTTAHLASALDDGFAHLKKLFGIDGLRLALQSHQEAIDFIANLTKKEKIDCDFAWLEGYLFPTTDEEAAELQKEAEVLAEVNVLKAQFKKLPIAKLSRYQSLVFAKQGQFHPLKYLAGLSKRFSSMGGEIFTNTYINEVKEKGEATILTTRDGRCIGAQYAVITTNTPFNDKVTMHTKQAAYRSYAVGLEIAKGVIPTALYWDMHQPYHYVRIYERKDQTSDILIVGGEDHKTGQDDNSEKRFLDLIQWAQTYFSNLGVCRYRWSGQIIEPVDSLAFIGLNPGDKRTFIATGDSGHGLTHGTIAGQLISDLILKRNNPWEKLYQPARKNWWAACEFAQENLNVAKQYLDTISPGEVKNSKVIAPGEGAVIRKGIKKIAVYRNKQGKLQKLSAVCPHLGCIVKWNKAETTWDCPCHGSRFNAQGEVLNGPAHTNLEKL